MKQSNENDNTDKRVIRFPPGEAPSDATVILKHLFDRIIKECGVTPTRWAKLCEAYIKRQEQILGRPIENHVEAKASIHKNFGQLPKMTFKNIFKGFIFSRIKRVTLTVTLEHVSGATTEHGVSFLPDPDAVHHIEPELDYDPRIPELVFQHRHTVGGITDDPKHALQARIIPPPELSQYAGRYPAAAADSSGSDRDGNDA